MNKNVYQEAADTLIRETGVTWVSCDGRLKGTAYTQSPDWKIVAPRPTSALRFGIFAHEVGHQMLHRHGSKPRWQEEIEAWEYALAQFNRFGLPGANDVADRAIRNIQYAIGKALRRSKTPGKLALRMLTTCPQWHDDIVEVRDAHLARVATAQV